MGRIGPDSACFRGFPVFTRAGMQFESHLGHSVSAGQKLFVGLVLTKLDFSGSSMIYMRRSSRNRRWIEQRPLHLADQMFPEDSTRIPHEVRVGTRARVIQVRWARPCPGLRGRPVAGNRHAPRVLFLDAASNLGHTTLSDQ